MDFELPPDYVKVIQDAMKHWRTPDGQPVTQIDLVPEGSDESVMTITA